MLSHVVDCADCPCLSLVLLAWSRHGSFMLAAVPIFANDRLPSRRHGYFSSQGVSPMTCKVKVRFDHREPEWFRQLQFDTVLLSQSCW
jgi:hypothetical protein